MHTCQLETALLNYYTLIWRGGGLRGLQSPFQISKIKESNKTKQILTEDNPLEKAEERKSCMFKGGSSADSPGARLPV